MALKLHNTLSGKVEPFVPAEPGHAKVYVCGPTVYDYSHLGHLRCYLVYDVLVRHLRHSGLRVSYVRNITDVNDSILKRATENGEAPAALAARFAQCFHEDAARMGYLAPDVEPLVSEHIPEIIALIQTLIERGAAYASEGDVYFSVAAFPGYGKLSRRKLDELEHGASGRLDDAEARRKRHPADFALWKGVSDGTQSWPSPFGPGRPGWHIECSAMSLKHLGERFDLHGGGLDLVFPHHENEVAQSEAACGHEVVKTWMHNGFIEVNKEKMSKSLGNFFTAREAFKRVEPEAIRYFLMSVHYRAPLNLDWTLDEAGKLVGFPGMDEAERRVEYLYNTRLRLAEIPANRIVASDEVPEALAEFGKRLTTALDDDLNMPVALAAIADLLKHANELVDASKRKKGTAGKQALAAVEAGFAALGEVLGLGQEAPQAFLGRLRQRRSAALGLSEADVDARIAERIAARQAKDFARADSVRDALVAQGVELMDGPEGTTWRIP
jgi:cysteinyl-tRNA synthetase